MMCHSFTTSRHARHRFPAWFLCAVIGGTAFLPQALFGDSKGRGDEGLPQVASPRAASMSAAEVAEGMLEQNGMASSVEGSFEFTTFMNMGQRPTNVSVKDLRPFVYSYSGVFTADGKYNLVEHIPVMGRDGKQDGTAGRQIISDAKRNLSASDGYVRIAAAGSKPDDMLQQDYENTQKMAKWLSTVNWIFEAEGLEVIGEEADPRYGRIILAQQPLSKAWKRKFKVAVDRGFVAVDTELLDPASGDIVYRYEASDLREVGPGVWRPMTWAQTQYLAVSERGVYKGIRNEKGVPAIYEMHQLKIVKLANVNKDRPERLFAIEPPADTRKILEFDAGGNEVEVPLSMWPGIGSRGSVKPEKAIATSTLKFPERGGRRPFGWIVGIAAAVTMTASLGYWLHQRRSAGPLQ